MIKSYIEKDYIGWYYIKKDFKRQNKKKLYKKKLYEKQYMILGKKFLDCYLKYKQIILYLYIYYTIYKK